MGRGIGRAALAAGLWLGTSAAFAGPVTWDRSGDWAPGTIQGSTQNNPGPAAGGPFVWRYESIQGGGSLASADPWYLKPRELMKWDGTWWQTGSGAWSNGDDMSPPVMQDRMIHNLHATTFEQTPVVSWVNPIGDGAEVAVSGSVTLRWSGKGGLGHPVDVDVVLAFLDASSGQITPLLASTFSKPNLGPSINDEVLIPMNLQGTLTFDQGDTLVLTHRGRDSFQPLGMWVTVFDDINLTLVPTPGAAALLGIAGLVLGVRRKR